MSNQLPARYRAKLTPNAKVLCALYKMTNAQIAWLAVNFAYKPVVRCYFGSKETTLSAVCKQYPAYAAGFMKVITEVGPPNDTVIRKVSISTLAADWYMRMVAAGNSYIHDNFANAVLEQKWKESLATK